MSNILVEEGMNMLNLRAYFTQGHTLELWDATGEHYLDVGIDDKLKDSFSAQSIEAPHLLRSSTPEHVVIAAICFLNGFQEQTPKPLTWLNRGHLKPVDYLNAGHRFQIWSREWDVDGVPNRYVHVGCHDGKYYVEHQNFENYATKMFDDVAQALASAKQIVTARPQQAIAG